MNYKLKEFSTASLDSTDRRWNQDLHEAADVFPGDVWKFLTFAKEHLAYKDKQAVSLAYGIFNGDEEVADSIVEVIVSQTGKKWIKLLDCFIRPSLSEQAYKKDALAIEKLVSIYAAAIVGSVELADHHKATLVKVYGRTESMLIMLTQVSKEINQSATDLDVTAKVEGRWLVVTPIKKDK